MTDQQIDEEILRLTTLKLGRYVGMTFKAGGRVCKVTEIVDSDTLRYVEFVDDPMGRPFVCWTVGSPGWISNRLAITEEEFQREALRVLEPLLRQIQPPEETP